MQWTDVDDLYYTSYDVFTRENVSFGVFIVITSFRVQRPQKPPKRGVNRHFQAKRAIYYNLYIVEITAPNPTKFYTVTKTTKCFSCMVQNRVKNPVWRTATI